ncbi:hypothetical protein [Thioalkalivibrio halophilus]|uniref:Uncharacterized protein n=2 Tax=Thioalkalivibrio TaxID=106633 RepID=A0A1V2ZVS9_9GAMM|nr:hypothetical protein [Thioalkalivibrio halophilus]OOC09224.1 hypothetical protein B1A74_12030 [Thioalkalivibrio halophilus]
MGKSGHNGNGSGIPPVDDIRRAVEQMMNTGQAPIREAVEQIIAEEVAAFEAEGIDDFHGLNSDQMHRLLYHPFDSPELVTFGDGLRERPDSPAFRLLEVIAEACRGNGIKLTPKGNLPRAIVSEAREALDESGFAYRRSFYPGTIRNEEDLDELHALRVVADIGRFTRKYRGRLKLVRAVEKQFDTGDWAGLFTRLLRVYCQEFNWAYRDGYPELPIVQMSFLFTLYLLHVHGHEPRPVSWYEVQFLNAFPMAESEVNEQPSYWDRDPATYAERQAKKAWSLRSIERFACFFGLVTLEAAPETRDPLAPMGDYRVRALPLLDQAIGWKEAVRRC